MRRFIAGQKALLLAVEGKSVANLLELFGAPTEENSHFLPGVVKHQRLVHADTGEQEIVVVRELQRHRRGLVLREAVILPRDRHVPDAQRSVFERDACVCGMFK